MRRVTRRLRRRFAQRKVERFFAAISHALAKDDPASEHYYWKIAAQKQTHFHRTRERLIGLLGVDAADHLLGVVARRARSSRRILVLSSVLLWFFPGPFAESRGALIVFITPAAILIGSEMRRRNILRAASLLSQTGEYPLADFPGTDVRRAVRRHRSRVPASVLAPHPQRDVLAAHLGEQDPETLEIAGKLADEFAGTAVELLETARRLR